MKAIRAFFSELRLYVCNHIVAAIPSNHLRLAFYRKVMGFELEQGVAIHLGARFDSAAWLKMGQGSVLNENCRLDTRGGITIGRDVIIAAETIILTMDHDPKTSNLQTRPGPVFVEDNVFIGTRAMILPNVTLHLGAVVAAGAVVSRNVETLDIVGGVPAKSIGTRSPEFAYKADYMRFLH